MNNKRILVVDDEKDIRNLLCISLDRMGFMAFPTANFSEAKKLLSSETFDLGLTDVRLPDGNGIDLIKIFKKACPGAPIAVMTAYDTTDVAVDAMKKGAFDFLPKPIRHERLRALVANALENTRDVPEEKPENLLIGKTAPVIKLHKLIQKVSQTQAPVMISGESGTGKELVARAIHLGSNRRDMPFVAVNCGAIPSELMESEFFGHIKGSFTGAHVDKAGLFQAAEGGTLFLDEVADLPLNMQVKLLRAIQEKAVRPVGAQKEVITNVRILSATHRNLAEEVDKGDFRQDLYYRLNVIHVETPSLRERKEDIPILARHILDSLGGQDIALADDVFEALKYYHFPGNVRELENLLHRALALCEDGVISAEDIQLPGNYKRKTDNSEINALAINDLDAYLASVEKSIIEAVLNEEQWNRSEAARRLNLTGRQFRYKLAKYGLGSGNSED
ncbi:MAG: sigma-54 dependent transcriptional regulator [Pseudomonadales bacterium]